MVSKTQRPYAEKYRAKKRKHIMEDWEDERLFGISAIDSLSLLLDRHGVAGINIWKMIDDDESIYIVEAGPKKYSNNYLPYAIIAAAGYVPERLCTGCGKTKQLFSFVERAIGSTDGFGRTCKVCNRLNSNKSWRKNKVLA